MSEFNNRVAAQRHILQLVNRRGWAKEELFGLSSKAIERWVSVNILNPEAKLVQLVYEAAAKLFFLANKSQEQISDEYKAMSNDVAAIAKAIEMELSN